MPRKLIIIVPALLVFTLACQIYLFGQPPTATPVPTATPTNTPMPTTPPMEPMEPFQPTEPFPPTEPYLPPPEMPTPWPSPTFVPPEPTMPGIAQAAFIKNAMCRKGPSTSYEAVTSFYAGQVVEIVGRNPDFDNTWWLVVIPGTRSTCWVSLVTAQATGNFDDIPIIYPPY